MFNYEGSINLILGPMFSEKTSTLISKYKRYIISGKKCLLIKNIIDNRYNNEENMDILYTHDGKSIKASLCYDLKDIDNIIKNYDVICIDEIQFFNNAHIYLDKWANMGKIIEACGLNGTFNRKPFEVITNLLPLVENIEFKTAICSYNGNNACYSKLKDNNKSDIEPVIGDTDLYDAVDRKYFFIDRNK